MLGNCDLHGYEIHRELEAREMKIGIGRLYEILNQMHEDGLLDDSWAQSESGPKKRIYSLSDKGREARESILMDAINTVHEFYGEYLRNLPVEKSPFLILSKVIARNLNSESTIGYVVNKFTRPISLVLKNLRKEYPNATIYLVGPKHVISENESETISNLEGACNDIPTKDGFFDLLALPGFSGVDVIETCTKEWSRVLKPNGQVSVVTPTALLFQPDDPLNIGEFIEQREHPTQFTGTTAPAEELKKQLNTVFEKVEIESVVHISIVSAKKAS
ncbi:MAG: helix-turn-helix transcriptional regulator [Candidatus Thorarchaeota archaeon]|jgi:DNA-binding PadR family transcriptional regulator